MNNSYWIDTSKDTNYPKLNNDMEVDVCIIGAGIVGASTAYFLKDSKLKTIILEKNKVCMGVTAHTTAKITSQHGLFYKYLENEFGAEFAKKYLYSNQEAIETIASIVKEEKIDCDLEKQDAFVFATSNEENIRIKEEVDILKKLGFNAEYVDSISIPIKEVKGAIKFPNQAQFNPRKYVLEILDILEKRKEIDIFENSKVEKIKVNNGFEVFANGKKVKAKYVVLATHFPIVNFPGFHFLKMHQDKSYIIGVETTNELFEGMYISSHDEVTSFRTAMYKPNQKLLLIGGSGHKTGVNNIKLEDNYRNLENYAREIYSNINVKYRWSTEDCITLDKIPYIGQFSKLVPNMYMATGFKKWGMTTSHVAAKIISDAILGRENIYKDIYNSTRLKAIKNKKELFNNLKQTSYSLIINRFKKSKTSFEEIKNGEGGIINYHGKKIGIYKDEKGKVYAIKPYCKHLGCELSWNNLEKTWDCPCHGSRYTYEGKIVTEPTKKELDVL